MKLMKKYVAAAVHDPPINNPIMKADCTKSLFDFLCKLRHLVQALCCGTPILWQSHLQIIISPVFLAFFQLDYFLDIFF